MSECKHFKVQLVPMVAQNSFLYLLTSVFNRNFRFWCSTAIEVTFWTVPTYTK